MLYRPIIIYFHGKITILMLKQKTNFFIVHSDYNANSVITTSQKLKSGNKHIKWKKCNEC